MGDAAEGLIDADARLQERMEELEESRKAARDRRPRVDPEVARETESLRLARTELQRQFDATAHPGRKAQLSAAIIEVDRRLAEVTAGAKSASTPAKKAPTSSKAAKTSTTKKK
jgi:hypothetical protein